MKSSALRFHEIDFLRGLACISVLAFHFLWRGPRTGTMPGVDFPLLASAARYGYLGVHLFFVISGFVILLSAQGATPRSFAASRASRLYPALWAAATLTAGAAWVLGDPRFTVSPASYLVNLSMIPHWFGVPYVDGAYWSLGCELQFYILVWLALRLGLMGRLEWLIAGWLLVSAANAVRPMWPLEFWLDAKWAPLFSAGALFYLVRAHGVSRARLALLGTSFALAQLYAIGEGRQAGIAVAMVASVVTAIFALFWLIATGRFRMKPSPFVFYAGALTYPVYVIHQNLGFMIYGRLHQVSGLVPGSLLSTLALLLSISWCIHRWVERPLGQAMRRRLAEPSRARASKAEATPAVAPGAVQPGP